MVGNAPGKPGKRLGFEPANEIDNVVEPDPGPAANTDQGLRGVRGGGFEPPTRGFSIHLRLVPVTTKTAFSEA